MTDTLIHLESLPDAVVIVDARGRILHVNSHTEALLGYHRDELIGHPIEVLVPDRAREHHMAHRQGYEAAPRVRYMGSSVTLGARHKDGREVPVEIMLSPGNGGSVVAVVRDISARRQLELFRDEYVGYMSHDLKNPLSIIALQTRLLSRKLAGHKLDDELRAVEVIAQSAALIDRMVRELLELSYLESERVEMHQEATELPRFLEDVLARTVSTDDRWRVRLEIRDLSTAWIDPSRIERVVVNFVQNAFKYAAPESPIQVRVETRGEMAVVSVVDRGAGLTAEERSFVFDKYRRARAARQREGLGLGLYISRMIVEAHGGKIGVDSVPGEGSSFYFHVPLAAVDAPRPPATIASCEVGASPVGRLAGVHVLLVDDEANAISALAELLRDEGLLVTTATSGAQALRLVAERPADVVVLDVEMPSMSGLALLLELRARFPGIPAVFMTGYLAHNEGIAAVRDATGAFYIAKPVDVDELIRVLGRVVDRD